MTDKKKMQEIKKLLKKNGQAHLLAFFEDIAPEQGHDLLAQLDRLDWAKIAEWVANYVKKSPSVGIPSVSKYNLR